MVGAESRSLPDQLKTAKSLAVKYKTDKDKLQAALDAQDKLVVELKLKLEARDKEIAEKKEMLLEMLESQKRLERELKKAVQRGYISKGIERGMEKYMLYGVIKALILKI